MKYFLHLLKTKIKNKNNLMHKEKINRKVLN